MSQPVSRRSLLGAAGAAGMFANVANASYEVLEPPQDEPPKYSINFAAIGIDHDHINGIAGALTRGGGKFVSFYAGPEVLPARMADFQRRFPNVKRVANEDEILNDPSIQVIASSAIASQRAGIGLRAMRHGKDFLGDKPSITTLEQLAEVRKTIKETNRIFGIMYSERLGVASAVKAGELIKDGAIGKIIQVLIIAPHQVNEPARPAWFWDPAQYGGILVDIGSHQIDQFTYYTGSTKVEIVSSQIANLHYPHRPHFQDFGDVTLHGDGGFGYVRLDWYTPNGLGTWGDGRLFLLGTEGYMEVRKYADPAGRRGGNHLILVDKKEARYLDCSKMPLPFGPQFVADVVNRTHVAQDQEQALLTAELSIQAQRTARRYGVT
jgi:predicted dehydrogenase